jgi:hypothetical protein
MTKFKQWLAWTWDGFAEHKSDLSSTAKGGQIQAMIGMNLRRVC